MDTTENLTRVRERIAPAILKFASERTVFRMVQLQHYVDIHVGGVAPDSPGRILRDLRRAGELDYRVVSRRNSLYEFVV